MSGLLTAYDERMMAEVAYAFRAESYQILAFGAAKTSKLGKKVLSSRPHFVCYPQEDGNLFGLPT